MFINASEFSATVSAVARDHQEIAANVPVSMAPIPLAAFTASIVSIQARVVSIRYSLGFQSAPDIYRVSEMDTATNTTTTSRAVTMGVRNTLDFRCCSLGLLPNGKCEVTPLNT